MIHFRKSLKKDEFLSFAIKQLASRSKLRHGLYFAISPLGYLETFLLRIEDHLLVLQKLWLAALLKVEIDDGHNSRVEIADSSTVPSFVYWLHRYAVDLPAILKELKTPLEPVQYKSTAINWTKLAARGLKMQIPLANNNPYGFDNGLWTRNLEKNFEVYAPGAYDAEYLQMLAESTEWQDLHTLLEVLKTYGAKPLFLGRPMKGHLYDAQGISMAARKVFYDRISSTIRAYGFSVVTFEEFDGDDYFGVDNYPHTGHEAWVYVDKALDEFYHGNLPK